MNWVVNLAIYNLAWLAGVLGGNRFAWIGLLLVAGHFLVSPYRRHDAILAALLLGIGLVVDGVLNTIGFFTFPASGFPIPLWLMTIWLALATLPNHSLRWMKGRHGINALFGAIGGPLAYWGGVRLGAAAFNWPLLPSLLTLALVWAVLWIVIMALATRIGSANSSRPIYS